MNLREYGSGMAVCDTVSQTLLQYVKSQSGTVECTDES